MADSTDGGTSTLFDLLPVGAYRSSPQGFMLRANAALVRFNGYASEAELLSQCRDVAHEWYVDPRQRERFREQLERDGQVTGFVSEVYRHATREPVWITENAHIVRDAAGLVLYYEGTVEEITDRVRAQAALQRSEAHLRLITQQMPGMVFRVNITPEGCRVFSFVSDGVLALFGVPPEVVMTDGDVLDTYRHPDDRARVAQAVAHSVAAVDVLNVEFRIVLDSGEQKWVHLQSRPMPADGPGQERVGVLIDISAQKRAAEWRQARDRAEAADRAKTQLLSRVSHELRTPLNAVLGFGQLLVTDTTLDPRHRAWVQQIVASGQHLLALVEDVLDVSSAQTGQLSLACAAVDLRQVLAEAWAVLEGSGSPGDLHFDGDGVRGPPLWVQGDARRLKQVASNLLSNAIQYNRPGGRVSVRTQTVTTPLGNRVELRVADTGMGMTPTQLARLFKPFERVGAQHIGVQGSGLGLALSKQLVEAMGGTIGVQSVPGEGSVFTVQLPAPPGA
ncbi:sensor histidine kinase [Aquabacterium sp.]|uniref:sensor histidine kinase n=1 Tax=Aquabacterium sp. TaxID=1872578 RepID=UPI002C75EB0D|nr:PAS domain-containing sensor histidine kinase [Aquabacterium sp.]HSW08872.1 PAS domain-containing sensor histidine kinase [Aquabacterium sp.]